MLRVSPSGAKAWYVQLDRNRKRKIGDAGVFTASMARYRARDLLQRASRLGSPALSGYRLTLGAFLNGPYDDWIGQKTRFGRRDTKRLCSALGPLADERLNQIGLSHIERWKLQRAMQVRPATLQRELTALKSAFKCAVDWRYLPENPLKRMKSERRGSRHKLRVLGELERAALMKNLASRNDHLSAIVLTALNTGMSRGELFRLRWKDVHFGTNPSIEVRHARKYQNRPRIIPLNPLAADTLKAWRIARRRRGTLVFPSPSGGRLKSIDTAWKRLMKNSGIRNFRFCDCRHDFAARLVQSGVPLSQVRDLLGHSTITLTERYAAFSPGSAREAVNRLLPA
jgi:integrase